MQGGQNFHPRKLYSPITYDVGSYAHIPVAPPADATPRLGPGMGPIPSPSKGPKNFIIFDQTDNKCQIMFYPGSANKFNYPEFNIRPTYPLEKDKSKEDESNESSSFKEDTKDIDALLSLSEGEEAEDDEEVSTGRTMGNSGGISPDSSRSTDGSKSCKTRLSSIHSSPCSSNSSGRKRQKMKKLIKALRSIVPGGDQMDSAAVLDESVRYLKSLKMEVKKLGISNLKHK